MSQLLEDGNVVGRVGAVLVILAVGFALHRLSCGAGSMCPMVQTGSCCTGAIK